MNLSRSEVDTFLKNYVIEISGQKQLPEGKALLQASLIDDFHIDSLDFINLLFRIEQQYNIKVPEEDIDKHELYMYGKLLNYIVAQCQSTEFSTQQLS